jgi:hypothetical protein
MRKLATSMNVNLSNLPLDTFIKGTKTEYSEHGPHTKTGWPIITTVQEAAAIAMAHLMESIYYYDELDKLEKRLERHHKHKKNPVIIL